MSPAEVIGGVVVILVIVIALVLFSEGNTRHHKTDDEEANVNFDERAFMSTGLRPYRHPSDARRARGDP